jgi:hypothetical protein
MIHQENEAERPTSESPPIQEHTTTAWFPVVVMLSMLFIGGRASGGPPTEEMCKIPGVQNAVATLFGFQAFFDGLPGLILAMPYGVLADQIGRKRILVLSMLGQVLGGCWVLFICM